MASEKFRRQLRQETEKWWAEGLIDVALHEKLAERYQFNRLERDASNRFVVMLLGLGAILLGLGAITFVAANWQGWSRTFRVILLQGCFVGINAAGFYLWRRPASQPGQQRLGHGLLLLGAMLLGANMGLMSQMFHQSGEFYELLLIWGLGVVAMAYSLRLPSLGILALILVVMAYWFSWPWQELTVTRLLVQRLPLVISLVFVPLAYWCRRSRAIFGLSAIALSFSLVFNLRPVTLWSGSLFSAGLIVALAFGLPPALLWSYSDRIWQRTPTIPSLRSLSATVVDPFQPIARRLAIVFLSISLYCFAFHGWWTSSSEGPRSLAGGDWVILIDCLPLSVVAGLGWLQIARQLKQVGRVQEKAINSGMIAALLVVTTGLFLWHLGAAPIPVLATFAFNVMLFLLALGLLRDGLALSQRHTFWGGMVLLVLGIISRMLEYNTDLLFKSIVFILCGAGVIVAGLWFERNLRSHHSSSLSNSSSNTSQEGTP